YTPNAGGIVSNSGSQTVFDNTGNMQYRHYIRRPDQGVYSIQTGSTYVINTTVLSYQFAVSRGHNYGGQDFPTTKFNGPSNIIFGLDESNPYRPKLSPLDGTNIFNPATYTVASTNFPSYHAAELDYQGGASLSHAFTIGGRASTFEMGFLVRDA